MFFVALQSFVAASSPTVAALLAAVEAIVNDPLRIPHGTTRELLDMGPHVWSTPVAVHHKSPTSLDTPERRIAG